VKKVLTLMLVLAMVLGVAGCGGSSGASASPAQSSKAAAPAPSASTAQSTQSSAPAAPAEWKPERPITFYLYSGAGGDTDTSMRALAAVWEQYFGVTCNVVNMTGGGGGLAANQVYGADSDGYTLFGMAEGVDTMSVLGAFDHGTEVWDFMLLFGGYGCLGVPANSPYAPLQDVFDAAKGGANIRISCSSSGSMWHLKSLQFEQATGVVFNILTYDGSNKAVVGLLSGEVEVVISSLGEQTENILAKNQTAGHPGKQRRKARRLW
jgi:tripartite-type tricarboxylate transporter receptor subunit TctC